MMLSFFLLTLYKVLQTIIQPNSLLSGVASYPAEGGYIYFCPSGDSLYAYSFGKDSSGKPQFTLAGKTALTFAGRGVPSVTSLNGTPGTGIVWLTDVNNGLVAYNAVPVNGVLVPYTLPAAGRLQKMQRPGFGNGRVYTTSVNQVIGIGGSVSAPSLTCTPSPLAFGSVTVGQTSTIQVTCKAGSALTLKGCTTGLATFQCSGIPTTVASGASFTFPVVFNVTNANIEAARLAGYQVLPGAEGGAINILSSTGAVLTSVQATATVVASGGYLVAGAVQIDFGANTVGSPSAVKTVTLTNQGAAALTFSSFAYQDLKLTNPPFVTATPGNPTTIGNGFTSTGFPAIGSTIAAGATVTLSITFTPGTAGSSSSLITFYSDGGYVDVMLVGTATQSSSTSSSSAATSTIISSAVQSSSSSSSSVQDSSSVQSSSSVSGFSSSSVVSSTSYTSTTTIGPSSVAATTTSVQSSSTGFVTSTRSSSLVFPTATGAYTHLGCYADTSAGHAFPLLFKSTAMTPQLCESYVMSLAAKPTPTVLPYYFMEYASECYGGSVFNFGTSATVRSLTGTRACTKVCSGSVGALSTGTAHCGGSKQFDLYAATSTSNAFGLTLITASK